MTMTLEQMLEKLRCNGWTVAIHNDYKIHDVLYTFWLFTHSSGVWIKGESQSDALAVRDCLIEAQNMKLIKD